MGYEWNLYSCGPLRAYRTFTEGRTGASAQNESC